MEVAVDFEEVLASTHDQMLEVYNDRNGTSYSVDDIQAWEWVSEELIFEEFMGIVANLWADEPLRFQPMEEGLSSTLQELSEVATFDIVTARNGDFHEPHAKHNFDSTNQGMEYWLEHHGIDSHRVFKSVHPNSTKATLGYDYYVDDKPELARNLGSGQHQFLVKRPWNTGVRGLDSVTPVDTVAEAVELLRARR